MSVSRTVRIGADFAAMTGGWMVRVALGLVVSVLIARHLAPAEMGRYAFLIWLAGLLAVARGPGGRTAVARHTAEALGAGRPGVAGALLGVVVRWQATLALAASAVMAAAALLVATPWRVPLALTALSLPSLVLHGSVAAFLSGLQAFRRQALLGVATLALQIALFALVVLVDGGVVGFVLAHAVAKAAGLAAVAAGARSPGRAAGALPASPLTSPARAEMLRYARSVSALVVLDAVVWQRTEVAFLQWMSSPAEVAFYALAFGVAAQVARIPYQASLVLFPSFHALVGGGRVAAQGLGSVLAIRAAVRAAGAAVPAGALARIVAAAALMGAAALVPVVTFGGGAGLVMAIVVGALVYPLALRVLHAFTTEDLDRLRALVERLPVPARSRGLALAGFLCGEPSRAGSP